MDARRNLIVFNASQGCEKLQEHLLLQQDAVPVSVTASSVDVQRALIFLNALEQLWRAEPATRICAYADDCFTTQQAQWMPSVFS